MADREVKIKITTTADPAAVREYSAALGDVSNKTRESVPATEADTQATEKDTLSKKELRQALHLVGKESPEAAIALRAFSSSVSTVGILVAAASYAVGRLKGDIKNLNDSLTPSEWETYKGVVEAFKGSLEKAGIEAAGFERSLGRVGTAAETASDKLKDLQEMQNAEAKAIDAVEEAEKRLELEQAKTIKDPIERAQKQLEIERQFADAKKKRADEEAQNALGEKRQALAEEEDSQGPTREKLEKARAARDGLGMSEESVNKKLEVEKSRQAAIDKEVETKEKRLQDLQDKSWGTRSTPEQMEMNSLSEQMPSLYGQQQQQRGVVATMEKQRPEKIEKIQAANEAVKELERILKESVEHAAQLRHEIPKDEKKSGIAQTERDQLFDIGTKKRQADFSESVLNSKGGNVFREAANGEDLIQHGQQASNSQQAAIKSVENMLKSHHENSQAVLAALGQAAKNDEALAKEIAAINRRMQGMHTP